MNENNSEISEKVYDLEMNFEQIVMLAEIVRDFGEYNAEVQGGAEKMHFLSELLTSKCYEYKKSLGEFIPKMQRRLHK